MLQKEAIEPRTLQLLEAIQADSMFAQFHLAGGTGLAITTGSPAIRRSRFIFTIAFRKQFFLEYLEKEYHLSLTIVPQAP